MVASFDGVRKKIAINYNNISESYNVIIKKDKEHEDVSTELYKMGEAISELRLFTGLLLAFYDDKEPDDCNDLSDDITLHDPPGDANGEFVHVPKMR